MPGPVHYLSAARPVSGFWDGLPSRLGCAAIWLVQTGILSAIYLRVNAVTAGHSVATPLLPLESRIPLVAAAFPVYVSLYFELTLSGGVPHIRAVPDELPAAAARSARRRSGVARRLLGGRRCGLHLPQPARHPRLAARLLARGTFSPLAHGMLAERPVHLCLHPALEAALPRRRGGRDRARGCELASRAGSDRVVRAAVDMASGAIGRP